MRRAGHEHGFALPLALAVIAIVAGFGAVAIALATHNVDRSSRDRSSARALGAADAGLDAAAYRMGKMLLASDVDNLVSDETVDALQAEAGCLQLSGEGFEASVSTGETCAGNEGEAIDATVDEDGLGSPAEFQYWIKLRAHVLVAGRSLFERQIVSAGEVDGVTRRVAGIYRFDLEAPASSFVSRTDYAECTAEIPGGADPAAGC